MAKRGGGLGDGMLGRGTPRGGRLASMIDMDGNGNPLDDIMRMVGR